MNNLEFMRQTPEPGTACWCVYGYPPVQILVFPSPARSSGKRFAATRQDPLKQWKLSPIDVASLDKWDDYTEAKEGDVLL